jgi:hypothetical protein
MFQTPDQLCKRFNYPASLQALLEQLLQLTEDHVPHLHSLLLTGSITTGDFVYERGGQERFFSDLDVFIYLEPEADYSYTAEPAWKKEFLAGITQLENRVDCPLFHVDVSINPLSRLKHIPEAFQFAEVRQAGVVIAGEDITYAFPNQFDSTGVQQAYLLNFTKAMLYWPGPDNTSDPIYAQVLARMILDLPMLTFAREDSCIPGHQERAKTFLALPPSHPMVTEATRDAIGLAVAVRNGETVQPSRLQQRLLPCTDVALNALDGAGPAPTQPDEKAIRRLGSLLPRRSLRRLAGDFLLACQLRQPVTTKIQAFTASNEARLAAANLSLLNYGFHNLSEAPPLGLAKQAAILSGEPPSSETGLPFYFEVRRQLLTGLCRYSRSWREKEGFYRKVIERAETGGS